MQQNIKKRAMINCFLLVRIDLAKKIDSASMIYSSNDFFFLFFLILFSFFSNACQTIELKASYTSSPLFPCVQWDLFLSNVLEVNQSGNHELTSFPHPTVYQVWSLFISLKRDYKLPISPPPCFHVSNGIRFYQVFWKLTNLQIMNLTSFPHPRVYQVWSLFISLKRVSKLCVSWSYFKWIASI